MNKIKEYLKSLYSDGIIYSDLRNKKNKRCFLIGLPVHGNYGDHIIGCAEYDFVKKYFPELNIIELSMAYCNSHREKMKTIIQPNDIILISGGGWMGDLYKHDEDFIRYYLKNYRDNKIIIFPQTIFYEKVDDYCERGIQLYRDYKHVMIMCRDQRSYEFCVRNGVKSVLLYPDMSLFYYGNIQTYFQVQASKGKGVGICLRHDKEGVVSSEFFENIKRFAREYNYLYEEFTTDPSKYVKQKNKRKELQHFLNKISQYDVVITDRLHAMVMATLVGDNCYFVDNKTKKVSGVYWWINEIESTKQINPKEIPRLNENNSLNQIQDSIKLKLNNQFEMMANDIRRFIYD